MFEGKLRIRFRRAQGGGYWVYTRDASMSRAEKWEDGELRSVEWIETLSDERLVGRVWKERVRGHTNRLGTRWFAETADDRPVRVEKRFSTRVEAAKALEERRVEAVSV